MTQFSRQSSKSMVPSRWRLAFAHICTAPTHDSPFVAAIVVPWSRNNGSANKYQPASLLKPSPSIQLIHPARNHNESPRITFATKSFIEKPAAHGVERIEGTNKLVKKRLPFLLFFEFSDSSSSSSSLHIRRPPLPPNKDKTSHRRNQKPRPRVRCRRLSLTSFWGWFGNSRYEMSDRFGNSTERLYFGSYRYTSPPPPGGSTTRSRNCVINDENEAAACSMCIASDISRNLSVEVLVGKQIRL